MKHFLFLAIIIVSLTQCKKANTGPQGPAGNANVQTILSTDTNWTYLTGSYYLDISASNITQPIIDKGTVLGYISFDGFRWYLLPFNYGTTSYFFSYELNHVSIEAKQKPPLGLRFKITTIAGN